jgi:hypothetical protein
MGMFFFGKRLFLENDLEGLLGSGGCRGHGQGGPAKDEEQAGQAADS